MKKYSDISQNAWLAEFGFDYYSSIIENYEVKGDFKHYVNVYMGHHTGCVDGRLQTIKGNFETVITYYIEHAGKNYDIFLVSASAVFSKQKITSKDS